ncbi:tyrosine-type recombinase/integrase [Frankia tisae]|uniref:tyrosine-type recombinase/integrase n=1 Tax=Frankia tisae TaxID=2950104 RepID=UPI0021C012A7|nr:tyrosine-type recombinase/integrase [Frankia tisae]
MEIVSRVTAGALDRHDPDAIAARHIAAWLLGYSSPRTRTAYARDVRAFVAWLTEHDVKLFVDHRSRRADDDQTYVDRGHVQAYARKLEADGAAPSTVARTLSSLSSFYGYLLAEDVIDRSPCDHVRRPKISDDTRTVGLTRSELRALLTQARADSPRAGALLTLLAGNGLRVGEALAPDVSDLGSESATTDDGIEVTHRILHIVRKGGKRTRVPLAPPTAAAVDRYLDGRETGPLFATRTGRHLDEPYTLRLIRRVARDAGIPTWDKLSPHSLRHTFVTLALDAGIPLHKVQDAAGHADPRTTQKYNRMRQALNGHPAYGLAAHLAGE